MLLPGGWGWGRGVQAVVTGLWTFQVGLLSKRLLEGSEKNHEKAVSRGPASRRADPVRCWCLCEALQLAAQVRQWIAQKVWRLGCGLDSPGFHSRHGQESRLFSEISRPAVGPIEPPTRWVPGFFLAGKEAMTWCWPLTSNSTEVKNVWSYTWAPPICLLGMDRDSFTFTFTRWVVDQLFDFLAQRVVCLAG